MAMATCPECGTRISDKAKRCPYCGCVSEDALMPLSAMPPATQPTKVIIPQASVFDNGINLLKPEDNAKIVEFLTDAERMAQFAPVIYEAIMKTIGRSENKYVVDFSKKAEELMKKGELRLQRREKIWRAASPASSRRQRTGLRKGTYPHRRRSEGHVANRLCGAKSSQHKRNDAQD